MKDTKNVDKKQQKPEPKPKTTFERFIGPREPINQKKEFPKRSIAEPPTQSVVKGPREGFIEHIDTNIQLVTKRIKTDDFKMKHFTVGRHTKTKVTVAYLETVADQKIVEKVAKRISEIDIDGIIDSYYILQFLQDKKSYLFRQVGGDEKPDITASKLLEGRVAIFVDGSPIVLSVPYILFEDIQNSDDYYSNAAGVSLRRFIRVAGAAMAIVLPGLYIAMQLYHYKIVPLNTLVNITNAVQMSLFSPMLEILFVLILFEILYEAALRMPRHLGMATGLIGAIVLGGAAVEAGLVSGPAVVVAALSGIMMYVIPNLAPQISLLRLFFVLLGGVMGLYGLVIGAILLCVYMNSLDSYGAPLLAPYAPLVKGDLKDGIVKKEIRAMDTRPKSYGTPNERRQGAR